MADPGVNGAVAPEDRELRALLGDAHTIAVVGLSSNPDRPSNSVAAYLQDHGYRIVPVNPKEAYRIASDAGLEVIMGVCIRSTIDRLDTAEGSA